MWKTIQALFERISAQVENNPTPFVRYLQLFFAILTLRLTLEFFSSQRLFTLDDILHIGLWFMFIVLAFLLQLHFFSGEKILRISKLVITFFSIALTAPIIDMLIFQGKGAKMNYLSLHTWEQVVYSYCTVGGASFSRGATPGIRVEIILLLMACFNYVYLKRKSVFWSILSVWSIYTVLFISGAIPTLLGILVSTFHLQYQPDDQSTLLLLLTANLFLLLIAVQRYSPTRFSQIWRSVPWISMWMALLYGGVGAYLALHLYPDNWKLTPTTLFWFPLLSGLFVCFSAIRGVQNWQDPTLSTGKYHLITNTILLLILIIGLAISPKTFFMAALAWSILFFLNEPPLQFQKIIILRNILEGMLLLAAALLGFVTFGAPMIGFPSLWLFGLLGIAIVFSVLREGLSGGMGCRSHPRPSA
ncbi:MAG: hypothetical protein LCH81_22710 [Bacteroidetes bacterium]|nr:hypothetical protein [Bacteroidota bacterium]